MQSYTVVLFTMVMVIKCYFNALMACSELMATGGNNLLKLKYVITMSYKFEINAVHIKEHTHIYLLVEKITNYLSEIFFSLSFLY